MAATDQTYRNQKYLDIVFGVTCVLMLVGTVWMFAQDYFREFKVVQRQFRDVEEGMAQRTLVSLAPTAYEMQAIEAAQQDVVKKRADRDQAKAEMSGPYQELLAKKVKTEDRQRFIKADLDSVVSFYNIAIDKRNAEPRDSAAWQAHDAEVKELEERIKVLRVELANAQADVAVREAQMRKLNQGIVEDDDGKERKIPSLVAAEEALTKAENELKRQTADFDRFHKLAGDKRWGFGDQFRTWPVIDAFASPLRIQQYTLNDLPINYSFKYVTRYDRCTTCHQGIERDTFTAENLRAMGQEPSEELKGRLNNARAILEKRRELGAEGLGAADVNLNPVALSDSQVRMFSAHPRLDLFVAADSPHRAEKFGCTICHSGQGSATDFLNASHSPSNSPQQHHWEHEWGWMSNHYWDYTMLPARFIESSCIKCHHQPTSLVSQGSKIEAPKVYEGYQIIKELGCFGCHEISGQKAGKPVGPDLRLEPEPPLADLPPAERARILADTANPPGTLRKVGPNLRRIAEKTNETWTRQWLMAPRDFRPTTKMPHFYGLTNNDAAALKGTGQENYPAAEIHSATHLIFERSRAYLLKSFQSRLAVLKGAAQPSEEDKQELRELEQRIEEIEKKRPAGKELPAADQDQLNRGRLLFSERGCLACHSHNATNTADDKAKLPALPSTNDFGPDLTRIADKLGILPGDMPSANRWLVQWIMDPNLHHPRTQMPITHLTKEQASDIAAWLLSQKSGWKGPEVAEPDLHTLKKLAREHLQKAVPLKRELDEMLPVTQDKMAVLKGFSAKQLAAMKPDADEQELSEPMTPDKLKMYIGRKAINTLGCYGCHSIPGYENAKPIGTPLNDWGVKRADRLAFEDAAAFVAGKYHIVPERSLGTAKEPGPWAVQDGKLPYEQFFYDLLNHHTREGFLHQKLLEPRSYDFARLRSWEERLRMPQFRFSRKMPGPNAKPDEIAKLEKEEAEAREAVMTFILGLVAEDIPKSFIYSPPPDKQAEIKGRQVIEQFNCAGCHLVRPAVYDFKIDPRITWLSPGQLKARPAAQQVRLLENTYGNMRNVSDHPFPGHVAWTGHPPELPGRLTAYGVNPVTDEEGTLVTLTHALQFPVSIWKDGRDQVVDRDLPSATVIPLLPSTLIPQPDGTPYAPTFGGGFANALVPFLQNLQRLNPKQYTLFTADATGVTYASAASPPSLLYQGEKTQPAWLFRFLKDPTPIRPLVVLRMPKFNLSDDEAQAIVNYFSAVDKVSNPALGLEYPYQPIPQREESYLLRKNADYVRRLQEAKQFDARLQDLQPVWERLSRDVLAEREQSLKAAEKALAEAKEDAAKMGLAKTIEGLNKEIAQLKGEIDKKDFTSFKQRWEQRDAYLVDAYRMTASNICLACHQVGAVSATLQLGPPLQLSWERLRPDWTEQWLANPKRFNHVTLMPQNFGADSNQHEQYFLGLVPARIEAAKNQRAKLEKDYQAAKTTYDAADTALFRARRAIQDDPGKAKAELAKAEQAFATARDAFEKVRGPFEAADQSVRDLTRAFSRNQVTAVRDTLINYLKVVQIPENRNGPVPTPTPATPEKK